MTRADAHFGLTVSRIRDIGKGMWRKTYCSMYDGSLVGAGAMVFAVMNYVITKQEYHRGCSEWRVRLNPKLLGVVLGEEPGDVQKAIEFLCMADPDSTSKLEGGKRLVQCMPDSFEYRVVNGHAYQDRRDYEERLEQNREAKKRERARKRGKPAAITDAPFPDPKEAKYCANAKQKGIEAADDDFDKKQALGIV